MSDSDEWIESFEDHEHSMGYFDGRDLNSPDPSDNRSERYKHSFWVGRAEVNGNPIPAQISRDRVAEIERKEALT